ncbi:diguanylate cyclase domain-containing protein [Mycobacterium sp. 94-17]|uniref:diguanylate cyclase domain-containing protein n=1 Tax=Mycobacterium sp. 94-17 TaxID=2986147 RepID=UPI002D1F273D|nr:diguanylate cyclase [Mycobacterium sp. 94-17]MEB4210092.1 diguanylate cyclase [Mycobacterium sp. 94-17]
MKRGTGNPWRRFGLPARVGWFVLGGYCVAAALIAASTIFGWNDSYATRPADEATLVVCLVYAAACAGYAAHFAADRRRRVGWVALVAALLGWAVGEVIWAVYELRPQGEHAAHPAAEVVLSVYPVCTMLSLMLLSHLSRRSPRRLVLDGLIVATSLFVIAWVFVLDKQFRANSGSLPVTVTQVFADIVLLTTAIIMISRLHPDDLPSRTLLACGIGTISVADIVMVFYTGVGSYHGDGLADLGWVAGIWMLALAGLSSITELPTGARRDEITSRILLWLPYVPLVVAAAVGVANTAALLPRGPMAAALTILVASVLGRQFVVLLENQKLLSEVAREAFHDNLTGLANRAHFMQRLGQVVAQRRHDASPVAVLCLDLDNFKMVNDALGHPAGDELLIRVAGRITGALGDAGTVARLGGDEFAVLIEASVEQSQAAAHRILEAFGAAIVIEGVPLTVRPSIGFTVATTPDCSVDQLLRHADLAMYAAKRQGGQCIRSFVPDVPFPFAPPEATDSRSSDTKDRVAGAPARAAAGHHTALMPASGTMSGVAAPERLNNTTKSVPWPPTAIRVALGVLTVGVVAFAASTVLNLNTIQSAFFNKILYSALNLAAAGLIGVRAYRVAGDRVAWVLIAAGMTCSAIGDVIYALYVPHVQSPSAADPAYLVFYPFVYGGILLLIRTRLKSVPVPLRIDALVCALTAAAVAVALTAGPIHAATTRTPATVLVGLLYPWGDLILLAMAASMVPIAGWRKDFRWSLLVAGFVVYAAADTVYLFQTSAGSYRVGTLLDACWAGSSLLVATACWAPASSVLPTTRRGLGPYIKPVMCTVVALGVAVMGHNSLLAVTLAAASLIATAARFAVTFRDLSVLADKHKHSMTDELTGLPNRRSLATALTAGSGRASPGTLLPVARTSSHRALLLLNVYESQEISTSLGDRFGDELMSHIANRLADCVRNDDLLARAGGHEFAILMAEGSDLIAARAQAGRILEAMSEPFELDPITVQVDARIAIALCPDHCDHPQELLNRAETAIPQAKTAKSKIAVYDPTFELYRDNDPNLIEDLRAALLDGDELALHYQPKINASDGSIHSVEALLRWHHPRRGLLLPEEFLPAAERAGLMRMVANRTVNRALEQIHWWRQQGIDLSVAVNLSTTNLLDLDLIGAIERLLRIHDLPPDSLIIEITESALVDSVRSRNTVAELQRLGVRISLDDYGTGWSSLARLQDVSVDELKLDRIFVARLAHDPRSVAIVRSTVALANSLGADLVAEGVEDEITLNALRRYGCTITQGFVHSPAVPADELLRWILEHAPDPDPNASAGVND